MDGPQPWPQAQILCPSSRSGAKRKGWLSWPPSVVACSPRGLKRERMIPTFKEHPIVGCSPRSPRASEGSHLRLTIRDLDDRRSSVSPPHVSTPIPSFGRRTACSRDRRRPGHTGEDDSSAISQDRGRGRAPGHFSRMAHRRVATAPSRYRPGRFVPPSTPTCPRRARPDIREARTAAVGPFRSHPPAGATGTVKVVGSRTEHLPSRVGGRARAEPRIALDCALCHIRWRRWRARRLARYIGHPCPMAFVWR
jgi:hypothetical protein